MATILKPPELPTAFVFAGGGSLGAVQVGMLKALTAHGVEANMVVGSSVGSINAAYFAFRPDRAGALALEAIWRTVHRSDIFPITLRTVIKFLLRRELLVSSDGLKRLITANLPHGDIEDAKLPLHIVATDFLSGTPVVFSKGDAARAIVASCAIPAAFAPVLIDGRYLADGGLANNTPVRIAVELGAKRLIVLPTGFACALQAPPRGAIANALHALTLLIASQLVADLKALPPGVEYRVVPSLCPSAASPFDFTRTAELIALAEQQTISWLRADGLDDGTIPMSIAPHTHV